MAWVAWYALLSSIEEYEGAKIVIQPIRSTELLTSIEEYEVNHRDKIPEAGVSLLSSIEEYEVSLYKGDAVMLDGYYRP